MNKTLCVVSCALDTFSGYGAKVRGILKSLIELKGNEWDIKILSQGWGNCSLGFLDANPEWTYLKQYIHEGPLHQQPDIWIQDTVSSEFQKIGKFNVGFCSGIETTVCDISWVEGCNRMDLIITSSEHSKRVFENTVFEKRQGEQVVEVLRVTTPVVVLFEGFDPNIIKIIDKKENFGNKELYDSINDINEKFVFLFVGHWLQGEMGEDRKNVGLLIKAFYEIWKDKPNKPALLLKTNGANASYMDEFDIRKKIDMIKSTVSSNDLPNIYLLHGEFSDKEINELYNHPKIKSMVSLTKGEGFGRPLLEFSVTGKPIIASAWSGHLDFLKKEWSAFVSGELKPIHPTAQVPNILIEGSQWFSPNHGEFGFLLNDVYSKYNDWLKKSKHQGKYSASNFSMNKMTSKLKNIIENNFVLPPTFIPLNLTSKKLELPKLKPVN